MAARGRRGRRRARARRRPRRARAAASSSAVRPSRSAWKSARYGSCVPWREVAREPVQDDRGAAVPDREGVAPEPQREPERDGRDRDRVQALARRVVVLPRHADHDRVERLARRGVERRAIPRRSASACATDGGPAKAATAVSSRPRSWRSRRLIPDGSSEKAAQRRARERASSDVVLVRVAAEAAREPRRVEHERRADHGHAAGERPLERDARAASRARRRSRAASRPSRRAASRGPQAPSERAGAAVEDGLGRGDADDEIGLEREPDCTRSGVRPASPTWTRSGASASCTSTRPWKRRANVGASSASSSRCPARRLSPPATRIVWRVVGHAEPLELLDRGCERSLARIDRRAGQRQLRRLDDERRRAAARDERLERRAGEREAERVADGRGRRRRRPPRAGAAAARRRRARSRPRRASRTGSGRAALRDVAVQAEERRPEAARRPEAGREQVRDAPVGDHRPRARARAPRRTRLREREPGARAAHLRDRRRPAEQRGAVGPGEAGVDARQLDRDDLEGADDASVALGDEVADLRLREVLEDLGAELVRILGRQTAGEGRRRAPGGRGGAG